MIHDDTIFIRSNDELWCIANEAIASPLDDPALVASIAAAKDLPTLTPYLTAARPRYRREALLRLAALKPPLVESVRKTIAGIITQDLYQEVRAAAVLALDACDPAGLAGWQVFVTNCIAADKQWDYWNTEKQIPFNNAMLTARALGAKAIAPHIRRDLAAADTVTLFALISVANEAGLVLPSLVDRALDLMQTPPKQRHDRLITSAALYLVDTAKADPRSLPAVRQAKTITAEQIIRLFEWRLPVAEFPALLEEQIRPGAYLGDNPQSTASGLVANMIRRMEKAQAIPLLEKLGIARPEIKDNLSAIAKSLP